MKKHVQLQGPCSNPRQEKWWLIWWGKEDKELGFLRSQVDTCLCIRSGVWIGYGAGIAYELDTNERDQGKCLEFSLEQMGGWWFHL